MKNLFKKRKKPQDDALVEIPLIDAREGGMAGFVRSQKDKIQKLARLTRGQLGWFSRVVAPFVYPVMDTVSKWWLKKTKNPYYEEIKDTAKVVGEKGVYAHNVIYEWSCTTGALKTPERKAPQLVRVMDWLIKGMGKHIAVVHQKGPAGEFHNITWPGLTATFNGVAKGRFAAAINQAPMQRHFFGGPVTDWFRTHGRVFKSNAMPAGHLLRHVFENAANYNEAKDMLTNTPIASPVIFTLTGVKEGEGCVLERLEKKAVVREIASDTEPDRVFTTNHFQTQLNGVGDGWTGRGFDNYARYEGARGIDPAKVNQDGFQWFTPPLANKYSRLAMVADAASGEFRLVGTEKDKLVTKEFHLKP